MTGTVKKTVATAAVGGLMLLGGICGAICYVDDQLRRRKADLDRKTPRVSCGGLRDRNSFRPFRVPGEMNATGDVWEMIRSGMYDPEIEREAREFRRQLDEVSPADFV